MGPVGRSVYLWRLERGFTQAQLASRAGIPRPNLSDIERGTVEPSLRTLRRLSDVLGVRAGDLVEGTVPGQKERAQMGREAMERICRAVFSHRRLVDPFERELVNLLEVQMAHRLLPVAGRGGVRRIQQSWLLLKGLLSSGELKGLLSRLEKKEQLVR